MHGSVYLVKREESEHPFLGLNCAKASDWSHVSQSWSFPPAVHSSLSVTLNLMYRPTLRSKKESFLLMSAIRHMQCGDGGRSGRKVRGGDGESAFSIQVTILDTQWPLMAEYIIRISVHFGWKILEAGS